MAKLTVAFQGERGSFSEEAAYKLLGRRIRVLPCETFAATFQAVTSGQASACMVPIENTLAGSVYENFDLLLDNDLHIVGEVNLRIVHNLITMPGTARNLHLPGLFDPVALAQRSRFFNRNGKLERIPFYDTAGAVKMLAERHPRGAAAIASRIAAAAPKARILLETHLEDHHENLHSLSAAFQKGGGFAESQQGLDRLLHSHVPGAL